MEQKQLSDAMYKALAKAIYLAAALIVLAFFVDAISLILLFFLMAVIFAIGLSPVVNWFESRRVPRVVGSLIVLLVLLGLAAGLIALVVPRVSAELGHLYENLTNYGTGLRQRIESLTGRFPALEDQLSPEALQERVALLGPAILGRLGRYSLGLVTGIVGFLVLVTLIMYMLIKPRPLLRSLVMVVPPKLRDNFVTAYTRGATGVVNWVWANAIIGAIEGVATAIFLYFALGLPGAITWGVVTFFAELIPQLGSYIMAVPPLLVAIAVDPTGMTALYVLIWFIGLQQFVNNVLAPPIRASAMNIHPVSEIFAVLALAIAFGFIGAIIASPVVVFVKAFYDAFYTGRQDEDGSVDDKVEQMLAREVPENARGPAEPLKSS